MMATTATESSSSYAPDDIVVAAVATTISSGTSLVQDTSSNVSIAIPSFHDVRVLSVYDRK